MTDYESQGFEIHSRVFPENEIQAMRDEADRLQLEFGVTCLRRIRAKSSSFHELAYDPRLLRLIPSGLIPIRSILFDKKPDENWPVAWHQDLTISVTESHPIDGYGPWSVKDGVPHVQPPIPFLESMTTLRVHLDETPAANGALRVIPKSNTLGRLDAQEIRKLTTSDEVACECSAGDVLQMSPLILHASSRSKKPSRRRILHFEYAPPTALPRELRFQES